MYILNFRVDIYLSALFFYAVKKYFIIIICCQSLIDTIKCGDTYQKNDVLFNCQDWDDGLYIIYNSRGGGNVCEFLYKNDSFVTMTNIAPQTHTIDGYNITFQTGTWYASLWAHKIIY